MTERVFCPDPHDYGPGPLRWAEWAAEMAKTHEQRQCPDCRLFVIWTPLGTQEAAPEPGLFDVPS